MDSLVDRPRPVICSVTGTRASGWANVLRAEAPPALPPAGGGDHLELRVAGLDGSQLMLAVATVRSDARGSMSLGREVLALDLCPAAVHVMAHDPLGRMERHGTGWNADSDVASFRDRALLELSDPAVIAGLLLPSEIPAGSASAPCSPRPTIWRSRA